MPAPTHCPTPSITHSTSSGSPRSDTRYRHWLRGQSRPTRRRPHSVQHPADCHSTNPIWGQTASYGFEVLNQNKCGSVYCDYAPIAGEPWNTEDGGNTDFRTPYIGFSPNASYYKTAGNSAYDGLQAHLDKRLSHNYMVGASYTWSHTLDEQSDLGLFFTGGNPNNLRNSWASSDFDRTNVFSAYFQAPVPEIAKDTRLPHSSSTTGTSTAP